MSTPTNSIQCTLALTAATLILSACSSASESQNTQPQPKNTIVSVENPQSVLDDDAQVVDITASASTQTLASASASNPAAEPISVAITPAIEPTSNTVAEPAEVSTVSTTPAAVINTDNANAVIMQAFEVFSGRAYDRRLSAYPYVREAPPLDPINTGIGQHSFYETLACNNRGEKTDNYFENGEESAVFTYSDTSYADCSVHGDVLNGRTVLTSAACYGGGYQMEFTNDFSVKFGTDGEMVLSGAYKNCDYVSVENFNFDINYSGGSLSVTDANTTRAHNSISGSFRMAPPILDNQSVSVSIDNAFENAEDETGYRRYNSLVYAKGSMQINADDSSIMLDADNGDLQTVNVTISSGGETVTRTESWSNWFPALSFVAPYLGHDLNPVSPDGDGTLLNAESYSKVLTEVFSVMTGDQFGRKLVTPNSYKYPTFPDKEMREVWGFGGQRTVTCDNGGTATLMPYRWGYREVTRGWRAVFDNCTQEGITYTGLYRERDVGTKRNFSTGFTQSSADGSSTFNGQVRYKPVEHYGDGIAYFEYDVTDVYFDSTYADETFVLSDAWFLYRVGQNYRIDDENIESYSRLSGRMTLSSEATNHNTIKVLIPEGLFFLHPERAYSQNPTLESDFGTLHIDAGNGNELFLKAATGNKETFTVDIFQPGQAPIQITEQWQDWNASFGFNFDLEDE